MTKNEQALEVIAEEMIKANEHREKKRTRFERCTVVAVSNGTCTIRYNNFNYDKTRILNNIPLKVTKLLRITYKSL